jgi:Fibronectin type III domain
VIRARARWRVVAGVVAVAVSFLVAAPVLAGGPTVVVVRPSAGNGWTVGGSGVISTGQPAGGLGTGAVRVESEVATTGRGFVRTDQAPVAGTALADLQSVDYRVAVTAYPPGAQFLTGYVVLSLALDGNPANTGDAIPGQPNLVSVIYEPCYAQPANCTGTIQPINTWTTWSAAPNSPAWWNADLINGHPPATVYSTLSAVVLAAFPQAVITAMKVQVGQLGAGPPWQGWHGWLDGVRFTTTGTHPVDELVDFEPDLPALPGSPTNLGATTAGNSVTIRWSPPTTGGPPSGYVVTVNGVKHVLAASARSLVITGLTPGSTVRISVAATNTAGTGPAATTQVTTAKPVASETAHPAIPPTPTLPDTGAPGLLGGVGFASVAIGLALLIAARTRSRARR